MGSNLVDCFNQSETADLMQGRPYGIEVAMQYSMLQRQQEIATSLSFLQHQQKILSEGEHNAEYTLTPPTGSASIHAGGGIVRTYTQ
jgi:hypothetical protein